MIGLARAAQGRSYQLLSENIFATGGTQSYTIPSGTVYLYIQMWGGGGGGAAGRIVSGRPSSYYGGGGGEGGYYKDFLFYGGDGRYNSFTGPCENFDMQSGDTLEFYVGNPGVRGNTPGSNGAAGENTRMIAHKRNGVVVLDHDAVTGWVSTDEDIPADYYCASSYLFGLTVLGGGGGQSPLTIPGGAPLTQINEKYVPDRSINDLVGTNGLNNSGNTTASAGGTGGSAAKGGLGGTAGAAGSAGSTGTFPGGGGGGGGSNSTSRAAGGNGATGQVIIQAYG